MIAEGRLSINGCRYWSSESYGELLGFCIDNGINPFWIRKKNGKYYLRLWGHYRDRGFNKEN